MCIVTIGIFGLFTEVKMKQWITANTVFEETDINNAAPNTLKFKGTVSVRKNAVQATD